jgi:hypothetical protein
MSTWTTPALQVLEGYLKRNRPRLSASGADPDEVVSDLRRHVQEEIASLKLPVVTGEDVQRIVRQLGPLPEEEFAQEPSPNPRLNGKGAGRFQNVSWGFLVGLGVALPFFTLGFELVTRLCAGTFFDPLPTSLHVVLVGLVPLMNLLVLCFLWSGQRRAVPRWLWLGNGVAFGVSFFYSILFLPMSPFALIGVLYLGFGLIPLTPLIAFGCVWQLKRLMRNRPVGAGDAVLRGWGWSAAIPFGLLLLMAAPAPMTRYWIDQAGSDSMEDSRKAIQKLRAWGSENTMLMESYGRGNRFWLEVFGGRRPNPELARKVYYQVTGRPFNSVAPPFSKYQNAARDLFQEFDWDRGLGGETVAGRVKGISMTQSRLDGLCSPEEGWAYLEWIMEFKNVHPARQREARAQIMLPPGGAVSRLTLWVNGEEREAAFAGRGHVRSAYQRVAVEQRRDPVLVTTSGPDTILMQCFPIEPNGGTMKIRLGITAPLLVEDEGQSAFRLPAILERNFGMPDSLRHHVWMEMPQSAQALPNGLRVDASKPGVAGVRGMLSDAALSSTSATLRFKYSPEVKTALAREHRNRNGAIIRQTLEETKITMPARIAIVVDGSREMRPFIRPVAQALDGLPAAPEVSVWFARDGVQRVYNSEWSREPVSEAVARLRPAGGQDSLAALLLAWEWAAAKPDSVILWVHGTQPVLLGNMEALKQRIEWRPANGPSIINVAVQPGPNRIAEQLAGFNIMAALPRLDDLLEDMERLFGAWSGRRSQWRFVRSLQADPAALIDGPSDPSASSHIVRLWALDQIMELLRSRDYAEALRLAGLYQLVTPISGAVVLETEQQFKEAGLTPVEAQTVPTVPEPGTWALLLLGLTLWLLWFKGKRKFGKQKGTQA